MTQTDKKDIKSLLPEELEAELLALGEPKYRAKQVFTWLSRGVTDIEEMSDLPKKLRATLEENFYITAPKVLRRQVSALDGTIKYLWELGDGNAVETVVMSYRHGNTVCISTQVGCRQGCAFCASTIGGLVRNLEPSEMLDEVLFSQLDSGEPISNIVLMGIGEPLDNFDNVIKFLKLVNSPDGMNIGMRHISLSTCGLVEKFDKLADLDLQLTLSVSLHAPDMARLLAKRVKQARAHVNLIPLNHVEEREFAPSTPAHLKAFVKILEDAGVNVTIRRKLGGDVDASCGQLRRKAAQRSE